jgi:SAM-dependent methyltransferase
MCNAAIEHARTTCPSQPVQIVHGDAAQVIGAMPNGSQDCAICIGSSHALGGLGPALSEMSRVCRPGGDLIVGELYWRTAPPDALLTEIGMTSTDLSSLQETVAAGAKFGLSVLDYVTATPDQFRNYELAQFESGMRWTILNANHPDAEASRQRSQWWWDLYSRFADHWFGFAVFAYSAPV